MIGMRMSAATRRKPLEARRRRVGGQQAGAAAGSCRSIRHKSDDKLQLQQLHSQQQSELAGVLQGRVATPTSSYCY